MIGTTASELDSRTAIVRSQEAAIGDLIADAIRALDRRPTSPSPMAAASAANKLYPAGAKLTRRDILSELPFGNTTVAGRDHRAPTSRRRWRTASRSCEQRAGRFPQVSGPQGRRRPEGAGRLARRLGRRRAASRSIRPGRYKVASNNFMLAGGDGYAALAQGQGADRRHRRQAPRERGHGLRPQDRDRRRRGRRAASSSDERAPSRPALARLPRRPGRRRLGAPAVLRRRRRGRGRGAGRRAHRRGRAVLPRRGPLQRACA